MENHQEEIMNIENNRNNITKANIEKDTEKVICIDIITAIKARKAAKPF